MSVLNRLKIFLKNLFGKNELKRISGTNNHVIKDERKSFKKNGHDEYIENLKNDYLESSKNSKKDYKKLKFVNEVYVKPNPYDGTGFKKKKKD